jgi:hypothetical protein
MKHLKIILTTLVLSLSSLANAGVIEHTYVGATGNDVDSDPASEFEVTINDSYLITDLNVHVELATPDGSNFYWTDLDIFLSNGSTTVQLLMSPQNDEEGFFDVTFDDESLASLPNSGDAIGSFQSYSLLSAFNGQSINDTWTLSILDEYEPDEDNMLINFSIIATEITSVPEPTTLGIFAISLLGLVSRRIKK